MARRHHRRRREMGSWRAQLGGTLAKVASSVLPGYVFDPDDLAVLTREAVARFPIDRFASVEERRQSLFQYVIEALRERAPGRIAKEPRWFITRCGGAEFSLALLYAAANEYVALCGSNLGLTGADSGSYFADVWDFILEGENYNAGASPYEPIEVTRAGEFTYLGAGDRKMWSVSKPTWMLDYARGVIPLMSGHACIENATVALNLAAIRNVLWDLGRMATREHIERLRRRR